MKNKLLSAIRADALLSSGDTVTCALSGGADSVAMTHLLCQLRDVLGITVRACHFNHRLRGAESDADAAFCADFCAKLGIPFVCGEADVSAYAAAHGESIEEAARHCRYAFFETQPGLIATAHTADDQLETVLLALVRGTGLKGLCGVPPKRGRFIRPILTCTRQEVLSYLSENGLSHREDATNAADDCVRNRLRHHIVPLLAAENPSLAEGISQMTARLRQDEALLQAEADSLLSGVEAGTDTYTYRIAPLLSAPQPVCRRALRSVLTALGVRKLSAAHLEAVEKLLKNPSPSGQLSLPEGLLARRTYDTVCFLRDDAPPALMPTVLSCPCELTLSDGARFALHPAESGARLRADCVQGNLLLRSRETGDRLTQHGIMQTLKKRMIDRKIPKYLREHYPVLTCGEQLLAALPFGIDDAFLAADGEKGYRIEYKPMETKESADR